MNKSAIILDDDIACVELLVVQPSYALRGRPDRLSRAYSDGMLSLDNTPASVFTRILPEMGKCFKRINGHNIVATDVNQCDMHHKKYDLAAIA